LFGGAGAVVATIAAKCHPDRRLTGAAEATEETEDSRGFVAPRRRSHDTRTCPWWTWNHSACHSALRKTGYLR